MKLPPLNPTTPAVMAGLFFLLLTVERLLPLRRRTSPTLPRLLINFVFSALVFAVGIALVRPVAMTLIDFSAAHNFGLLPILRLPIHVRVVLGFLLMDLTFYYWHRLNHQLPIFWRFHAVHHLDPDMDVSTSFRFHVVEILYSSAFRALQVLLLGISLQTYIAYEIVFQCATMFHHSNLRIPIRLERLLNCLVVTPRMHGIHHSVVSREVDSDYSVIFRFWDALHRTLILNVPQADITIGLAGYLQPRDNTFAHLLAHPFLPRRQVEPLLRPSSPPVEQEPPARQTLLAP